MQSSVDSYLLVMYKLIHPSFSVSIVYGSKNWINMLFFHHRLTFVLRCSTSHIVSDFLFTNNLQNTQNLSVTNWLYLSPSPQIGYLFFSLQAPSVPGL